LCVIMRTLELEPYEFEGQIGADKTPKAFRLFRR
jgi:hypothetical protein